MTTCTWVDCTRTAKHPLVSQDQGDVFADLCDVHHLEFKTVVDVVGCQRDRRLLNAWVHAQGGPALAERRRVKRAFNAKVQA